MVNDNHDYVELRNAVCVRATLLTACRGDEPACMLISDWKEGEKDAWIDHQRLTDLDPSESMLVNQMKICYMTGKGKNHLVPVLIPFDTVATMQHLCDEEMQKVAAVHPTNIFVFPSFQEIVQNSRGKY